MGVGLHAFNLSLDLIFLLNVGGQEKRGNQYKHQTLEILASASLSASHRHF